MKSLKVTRWFIASEEPYIEVQFIADLFNDGDSVQVDGEFEYDHSSYTADQLAIIEKYIEDNRKQIEIELTENY
jgi:hypothetical protein